MNSLHILLKWRVMIQKEFQLFAAKNVETLQLYSRTSRFVFNKQVEVRKKTSPLGRGRFSTVNLGLLLFSR